MTRAYLPLLLSDLPGVSLTGEIGAPAAWVVSDAMRAADPDADVEELEFDAMCAALDAAAERSVAGTDRRVVVALDLTGGVDETGAAQDGRVALVGPVPLAQVVSWHVEEHEGVGAGHGYDDLLWYDVSELSDLAAEAG